MAEDVSSTIAALEDERYAAMLSGDTGKLDRLLDDRLRHVHSSGRVDNKASWMSNFGRLRQYRSIERQDQTIVPLADSALVFNTLHIDVQVADIFNCKPINRWGRHDRSGFLVGRNAQGEATQGRRSWRSALIFRIDTMPSLL